MSYDNCFRHDFWHAMGRRYSRHGLGGFVAGFMGDRGFGGGGFYTGRKLTSGDLQLIILALLAEKPSHGYELIKALEERSNRFYSPSPGMVYPALSYLEEIGYATVEAEGPKKLYRITDEGRRHLEENRVAVEAILAELKRIGSRMDDVRRAFFGHGAGDDEDVDSNFGSTASEELWQARRRLRMALHEKHHCSAAESRRIAAILRRAAAEILSK